MNLFSVHPAAPAYEPMSTHSQPTSLMSTSVPPGPSIPIFGGIPVIRILNLTFLIAVFVINGLASGTTFNNTNTGQLSDENPNFLVPSGYAFSIWGLIYMFLALWGVYQLLPRSYNSAAINQGIGYVFLINAVFNCAWIFVWAYRLTALSVVVLALILTTNLIIYIRLKLHHPTKTWEDTLCIHTGFSLYMSWTLGATLVNLWAASTNLNSIYLDQTIAVLVILGVIEICLSVRFIDPLIVFVGAWTVLANYMKNKNVDRLGATSLTLSIILIVVGVLVSVVNVRNQVKLRWGMAQSQA